MHVRHHQTGPIRGPAELPLLPAAAASTKRQGARQPLTGLQLMMLCAIVETRPKAGGLAPPGNCCAGRLNHREGVCVGAEHGGSLGSEGSGGFGCCDGLLGGCWGSCDIAAFATLAGTQVRREGLDLEGVVAVGACSTTRV